MNDIGQKLKDRGMDAAENSNLTWVNKMRAAARTISKRDGEVSADVLRSEAKELFSEPHSSNAMGAVFLPKEFRHIGWKPSVTPSRHRAWIRVWKWQAWS